jgi:hypothetical protein
LTGLDSFPQIREYRLAIDKICQVVAFGDDVDLILLARELVLKQAARKMAHRFADHSRLAAQLSELTHAPRSATAVKGLHRK